MANIDYRLDLLPSLQTGLQIGQQWVERKDRKKAEAARLEQEALQLQAQKQAAQQRALIDAQTLQLNQDRLMLQAQKYQTDEEIKRANLERQQWNDLLRNTAPAKERTQSVTYRRPDGVVITQNVPLSQLDSVLSQIPPQTPKEELIDVEVVVGGGDSGQPRRTVKRRMTQAQYDEMAAKEQATAATANAGLGNVIGKWDRKTGFQRTTK